MLPACGAESRAALRRAAAGRLLPLAERKPAARRFFLLLPGLIIMIV
jgi:hypothetical protein